MNNQYDSEWTDTLESFCRSVIKANYEETDLIDVDKGTIRPLLPLQHGAMQNTRFIREECSYEKAVRRVIEDRAFSQEDRTQLSMLLPGRLPDALKAQGEARLAVRARLTDGRSRSGFRWKRIECSFFRDDEKSILLLVSDIQDEEDVKDRLKEAAEEAEAANKAKSAFLANMSHEIRTPMNAIVGISEMLLREELPREVLNSISTIQNSGSSLLGIINDILDFSKIETGKFEIIDVEYMLPSLLMDISNVIDVRLSGKDVFFMMDIDPTLPNHFFGDDIRLKQILMNLIGNAVKFTHEGFIELKVRGRETEDGIYEMSFAVKDSGIGIREEDLNKLFSTFTQVDTRRNRATTGSGLGLSISKNLAQLMGGDVTVESVYGKGSTFTCTVRQRVPRYIPLGEVQDRSARILICENNEAIVRNLSAAMENLGLHYEICRELDRVRDYPGMTHVLVRRKLFEKMQEKLEFMFERSNILLILDHDEQSEGAFMDFKQLQLPLITLQLINALNGEEIVSNIRRKSFDRSEIIPLTYAKILLVDDNVTNLQVASGLMLPYQMQVDTTTSGFKAIEMVKKQQYDLIFMDHMMPEMDGIETARYIRGLEGDYFKNVPIVALTANAMSDARDMFREVGMDDFVAKPIEMRELHRVIKKYIQSKAPEGYLKEARKALEEEQRANEAGSGTKAGSKANAATNADTGANAADTASADHMWAGFASAGDISKELSEGAGAELLRQNGLLLQQNLRLLDALFSGQITTREAAGKNESAGKAAGKTAGETAAEAKAGNALPGGALSEEARGGISASIPGVDIEKCLDTYGGSVQIYHNILRTYSADMKEKETLLRQLVDDRDTENFTIQVHAVKSASRGAGAFELGEQAWQLEQAGKASDWETILRDYPAFEDSLHAIVRDTGEYVKKYIDGPAAAAGGDEAGGVADAREARDCFDPELVRALKEASEQMDYMQAESILDELGRAEYPEEYRIKLDNLIECCKMFDYDKLDALVMKL